MRSVSTVTGKEVFFNESDIIVSKTDLGGRITYANDIFLDIAGYREDEVLNKPHSLIRHPDMPRCVFKLLWSTIQAKSEVFAYVINRCKNGDHYWVLAHVTPSYDDYGNVKSYHSNRRVPERSAVKTATELYKTLRNEEEKSGSSTDGMNAAAALLSQELLGLGLNYEEFVFSLENAA